MNPLALTAVMVYQFGMVFGAIATGGVEKFSQHQVGLLASAVIATAAGLFGNLDLKEQPVSKFGWAANVPLAILSAAGTFPILQFMWFHSQLAIMVLLLGNIILLVSTHVRDGSAAEHALSYLVLLPLLFTAIGWIPRGENVVFDAILTVLFFIVLQYGNAVTEKVLSHRWDRSLFIMLLLFNFLSIQVLLVYLILVRKGSGTSHRERERDGRRLLGYPSALLLGSAETENVAAVAAREGNDQRNDTIWGNAIRIATFGFAVYAAGGLDWLTQSGNNYSPTIILFGLSLAASSLYLVVDSRHGIVQKKAADWTIFGAKLALVGILFWIWTTHGRLHTLP